MTDRTNDVDALAQKEPAKREVTSTQVSMTDFANDPAGVFAKAAHGDVVVFDENTGLQKYLIKALGLPTPVEPEVLKSEG